MSSRALQILAAVLVIVALVMALLAYQVSQRMTLAPSAPSDVSENAGPAAASEGRAVVVALRTLKAHRLVDDSDVAVRRLPVAPEKAYTDAAAVVGRFPLVDIDAGVPLTPRYFSNLSPMSQLVPENHKAVSIALDEVTGVGGHLQPGDRVDVVAFLRAPGASGGAQARTVLRGAMVLAVSERLLADLPATQEDDERSRGRRQQTAVLAVPAAQVARVVLASQAGDVRLALHRQSRSVALTASEPISDDGSAAALAELLGTGTTGRSVRRPSAATVKVHRADNLSEVSP